MDLRPTHGDEIPPISHRRQPSRDWQGAVRYSAISKRFFKGAVCYIVISYRFFNGALTTGSLRSTSTSSLCNPKPSRFTL
jgi:hypothetical protein